MKLNRGFEAVLDQCNHLDHINQSADLCNGYPLHTTSLNVAVRAWFGCPRCKIAQTRGIHSVLAVGPLAKTGTGWLGLHLRTLLPRTHHLALLQTQKHLLTGQSKRDELCTIVRNSPSVLFAYNCKE